jgi:hypothetical protein
MKLRIKGNSLRLRIAPSEMTRLLQSGRIEETIQFAAKPTAHLTYALEHDAKATVLTVRSAPQHFTVVAPSADVQHWADSSEVGIYGSIDLGSQTLEVSVEKDFACLDKGEVDNSDTFPNPHEGAIC